VKFRLVAVGTRMPEWVESGFHEYNRRLPADFALHLHEIPLAHRGKSTSAEQSVERETEGLLEQVGKGDHVITLEVGGRLLDSIALAERVNMLREAGRNVVLLVGGPDGLGTPCQKRADESWSLSRLTLPHPLVRLVLAEQFYRAWSLLNNHPYHR